MSAVKTVVLCFLWLCGNLEKSEKIALVMSYSDVIKAIWAWTRRPQTERMKEDWQKGSNVKTLLGCIIGNVLVFDPHRNFRQDRSASAASILTILFKFYHLQDPWLYGNTILNDWSSLLIKHLYKMNLKLHSLYCICTVTPLTLCDFYYDFISWN